MPATKITSRWVAGNLVFRNGAGTELLKFDQATGQVLSPGIVKHIRRRCTIAEVNAGVTLLAALAGYKYRLIDASAISVGGAAAAVTTVDLLATQGASSVKLVAFAQASLTQSALLRAGASGAAILADGASFVQNDVNTAVTVGKTGAAVTTATHVDILVSYAIEV